VSVAWAGGTFFPVVLLCQFLVLAGNRFWFTTISLLVRSKVTIVPTADVLRGQLEPLKIVLSVKVVQQSCQAHQELQESVLIVLILQVFAEIERIN
jgi:hypothetical protein